MHLTCNSIHEQVLDATLKTLHEAGLMSKLEDGREVIYLPATNSTAGIDENDRRKVVIRKSDGSSLYITRDIAAILQRLISRSYAMNS